jgi:hypothetical protein
VKNSETEISRCRAPISTAEIVPAGLAGFPPAALASGTFGWGALAPAVLGEGLARLAAGALDRALGLDLARVLSVALGIAII